MLIILMAVAPWIAQRAWAQPATDQLLKKVADIPLPGGASRFDYQSLDPSSHRLYFSHMGDGELMVFDTSNEKLLAHLPGFPVMTGVLAVPSLKRIYGSVTKNHEVAVVDAESLAIIRRIPAGHFPDGLAFCPETLKLYVSDESGGQETVIDTQTNTNLLSIPLDGEAGNTQYDPVSHLILVAVQTRNQLVAIDPTVRQNRRSLRFEDGPAPAWLLRRCRKQPGLHFLSGR